MKNRYRSRTTVDSQMEQFAGTRDNEALVINAADIGSGCGTFSAVRMMAAGVPLFCRLRQSYFRFGS